MLENVNNDNKVILAGKQKEDNSPNDSTFENHAYAVIGPGNVGKKYYMLEVLEKIVNKRSITIITRSPNQYANYKTTADIKPINKYNGSVISFDDMLGARNNSQVDQFFMRGRHEDLDVYYINQRYFCLTRQSIRNNSDRLIMFKQTLGDVQSMYYDIGAYDMKYDEFKEMCLEIGVKDLTIFVLIRLKIKMKVNVVFRRKAKTHINNVFPKLHFFNKINVVSNQKRRRFTKMERVGLIRKPSKSSEITREAW